MIDYKVSPPMFNSKFLDFFTRSPWWLVPFFWLPVSFLLLSKATSEATLSTLDITRWFFTGWFVWTLSEYWLHRLLFHWKPNFKLGKEFHFLIHGVHHKWPNDHFRLVMPLFAALILATIIGCTFKFLLGNSLFSPFYSGFLAGYVQYEMTHFAVHHLKWKNPVFKQLKRHHLLHHHNAQYKNKKYGVSSTVWDRVFQTY